MRAEDPSTLQIPVSFEAIEQLKFSACLPIELAKRVLELRLADVHALQKTLTEHVRYVVGD